MSEIIFHKSTLPITSLTIVFNAGSMYENKNQFGTRHLLEHLAFNNIHEDLKNKLDSLNIQYNGWTNTEYIIYEFYGLEEYFTPELKDEILTQLCRPLSWLNEEYLENEKSIILEEYDMSFSNPNKLYFLNYLRKYFNNFSVIGKKSDITSYSLKNALDDANNIFPYPNKIIETGRESTISKTFLENDITNAFSQPIFNVNGYDNELETNYKFNGQKQLHYIFNKPIEKDEYVAFLVGSLILSKGLTSPLYNELRTNNGFIYNIGMFNTVFKNGIITGFIASVNEENYNKGQNLLLQIIEHPEQYMTQERFDMVIQSEIIENKFYQLFDYEHIEFLFLQDYCQDVLNKLNELTLEKVITIWKKYLN